MVKNENKNFAYTTHRIGGTTYKVKVVFNDSSTETMEDKILRIIRNEVHTNCEKYDIIKGLNGEELALYDNTNGQNKWIYYEFPQKTIDDYNKKVK